MICNYDDVKKAIENLQSLAFHVSLRLEDLAVSEEHAFNLVVDALLRESVVDSVADTCRFIEDNKNLSYSEIIKKILGGDK